jgi:hypothetical protein
MSSEYDGTARTRSRPIWMSAIAIIFMTAIILVATGPHGTLNTAEIRSSR